MAQSRIPQCLHYRYEILALVDLHTDPHEHLQRARLATPTRTSIRRMSKSFVTVPAGLYLPIVRTVESISRKNSASTICSSSPSWRWLSPSSSEDGRRMSEQLRCRRQFTDLVTPAFLDTLYYLRSIGLTTYNAYMRLVSQKVTVYAPYVII